MIIERASRFVPPDGASETPSDVPKPGRRPGRFRGEVGRFAANLGYPPIAGGSSEQPDHRPAEAEGNDARELELSSATSASPEESSSLDGIRQQLVDELNFFDESWRDLKETIERLEREARDDPQDLTK